MLPGAAQQLTAQPKSPQHEKSECFAVLPADLIGETAEQGYLTDEALYQALQTPTLTSSKCTKVIVYNFPAGIHRPGWSPL